MRDTTNRDIGQLIIITRRHSTEPGNDPASDLRDFARSVALNHLRAGHNVALHSTRRGREEVMKALSAQASGLWGRLDVDGDELPVENNRCFYSAGDTDVVLIDTLDQIEPGERGDVLRKLKDAAVAKELTVIATMSTVPGAPYAELVDDVVTPN